MENEDKYREYYNKESKDAYRAMDNKNTEALNDYVSGLHKALTHGHINSLTHNQRCQEICRYATVGHGRDIAIIVDGLSRLDD